MPRKLASKAAKTETPAILQLKVTLLGPRPPIWRRIEVMSDTPLDQLHAVIQFVMGWEDCHMHQFRKGKTIYGTPGSEDYQEMEDEEQMTVGSVLKKKRDKLTYEYDFGDCWTHEILLEDQPEPEEGGWYPRCLGGERAAPPEDCGGVYGYMNLVDALSDAKHDQHEELTESYGGYDPEEFDAARMNKALLKQRGRARS